MKVEIEDCFRLALRGGPNHETWRGLTLVLATEHVDGVLATLANIGQLVKSQESLVERSRVVYGPQSKGFHQDKRTLAKLQSIQSESEAARSPPGVVALKVLAAMVNYSEN